MEFVDVIKTLLSRSKLKQADLCRMTGIPTSLMSEYIQGKKSPAIINAISIADALNVSLDELVGRNHDAITVTPLNTSAQYIVSSLEFEHIKKYRVLDERGKKAVDDTLEREYEFVKPKIEAKSAI